MGTRNGNRGQGKTARIVKLDYVAQMEEADCLIAVTYLGVQQLSSKNGPPPAF